MPRPGFVLEVDERTPPLLNGFALWVAMMIGLTLVNYGYPIAQLAMVREASVPVVPVGSR